MVKHSFLWSKLIFLCSGLANFLGQSPFYPNDKISCSKPIPFQRQNFMLNPIPKTKFHGQTRSIPTTKFHGHPHSIPIASRGRPRLLPNSWIMDSSFFPASLSSHWEALQRHYFTDDLGLAERLVERSEECAEVLRAIHGRVHERVNTGHPLLVIGGIQVNYLSTISS